MLEHVNHPFICNLRYSFQDIEYMYVILDAESKRVRTDKRFLNLGIWLSIS